MFRQLQYKDETGRLYISLLPENYLDDDPELGVLRGPPRFDSLDIPEPIRVRLHNELFVRGIHTLAEAMRRRQDVIAAMMAALAVDSQAIIQAYREE